MIFHHWTYCVITNGLYQLRNIEQQCVLQSNKQISIPSNICHLNETLQSVAWKFYFIGPTGIFHRPIAWNRRDLHLFFCLIAKTNGTDEKTTDCTEFVACHCPDLNYSLNSLAPGKFEWNFRYVIFKWILVIDGWGIFCEIALTWMSLDFTDDQSTLVQIMAWCRQATSHYHLSQCWPRSMSPNGITSRVLH